MTNERKVHTDHLATLVNMRPSYTWACSCLTTILQKCLVLMGQLTPIFNLGLHFDPFFTSVNLFNSIMHSRDTFPLTKSAHRPINTWQRTQNCVCDRFCYSRCLQEHILLETWVKKYPGKVLTVILQNDFSDPYYRFCRSLGLWVGNDEHYFIRCSPVCSFDDVKRERGQPKFSVRGSWRPHDLIHIIYIFIKPFSDPFILCRSTSLLWLRYLSLSSRLDKWSLIL